MKIVEFGEPIKEPVSIALGCFDAVHNGHKMIIERAKAASGKTAVFTFDVAPSIALGRADSALHTLRERIYRLSALKADYLILARVNSGILGYSPEEFVERLSVYDITKVVVGADYRFGRGGKADGSILGELLRSYGIQLEIAELLHGEFGKISSSSIRDLIKEGKTEEASRIMPMPYIAIGNVVEGRQVGRTMSIPTANMEITPGKLLPADGVYATVAEVGGKLLRSVTNVGAKPTFDCDARSIESYIIGYDGNLYGKELRLYFIKRLRGIRKFSSAEELKREIAFNIREAETMDISKYSF